VPRALAGRRGFAEWQTWTKAGKVDRAHERIGVLPEIL
jgi:hypothetical protein